MSLEFAGTFILTDDSVDRHSDRVMPKGVSLKDFKKNPVMFYNHHRSTGWGDAASSEKMPVGKWQNVKYDKDLDSVTGDAYIDVSDELGQRLFSKVELGVINAVSIGFRAVEWSDDDDKKLKGQLGYTFTKSDLLEASIVDIPSNKNALKLNKEFKKSLNDGVKDDLYFIKSFNKVEGNNKTTKMGFTDKLKGLLSKAGFKADNVEELEALAETTTLQDITKALFEENTNAINESVAETIKTALAENTKSFNDAIAANKTELTKQLADQKTEFEDRLEEELKGLNAATEKIEKLEEEKADLEKNVKDLAIKAAGSFKDSSKHNPDGTIIESPVKAKRTMADSLKASAERRKKKRQG